MRITHSSGGTPRVGPGAVQRWVDLLDAAERGLCWADPHDANAQRTAGRRIESLFLYEHQMTPPARRRARETVWSRHHPGQYLPEAHQRQGVSVPPVAGAGSSTPVVSADAPGSSNAPR